MYTQLRQQSPGAVDERQVIARLAARDESKGDVDKCSSDIIQAGAAIDQAKAALVTAQLNFDWCTVKSPCDGMASRHLVDVGDTVNQNVTVLSNIVSVKPLWAYMNVDQNTLLRAQAMVKSGSMESYRDGKVHVAMAVGVANQKDFPISGVIDYVGNQVDANTGTLLVRAAFANTDDSLEAGLFARVRVPASAPHQAPACLRSRHRFRPRPILPAGRKRQG